MDAKLSRWSSFLLKFIKIWINLPYIKVFYILWFSVLKQNLLTLLLFEIPVFCYFKLKLVNHIRYFIFGGALESKRLKVKQRFWTLYVSSRRCFTVFPSSMSLHLFVRISHICLCRYTLNINMSTAD